MSAMPLHSKVGAVVALLAIGLLASFTLTWPARLIVWHGLSFTLSGRMLLGLVLLGVACAGTDSIVRGHAEMHPQQQEEAIGRYGVRHPILHWILPAGLTTAFWALLARPGALEGKVTGVVAASGALALLIYAEYYGVNSPARWRPKAQFALQLIAYPVAALIYFAIRESLPATRLAADVVAMASALLCLRLLGDEQCPLLQVLLSALGVGSFLGLLSWSLRPRVTSPLLYSLLLVVGLYVLSGLARQFLRGKLRKEVSLEYLFVGILALLVLLFYAR
ncbi:MAG: hypothetical protein H5T68_02060 [Chloroflexi bacterium]|nr:hypothetical protein [Chloroflexota bacterium]